MTPTMARSAGTHRKGRSPRRVIWLGASLGTTLLAGLVAAVLALGDDRSDPRPTRDTIPAALQRATLEAATTPAPTKTTTRPLKRVAVPTRANGTFAVAAGKSNKVGTGTPIPYQVEVEDGLPIDTRTFARAVDRTLADPRGWTGHGYAFERVERATRRIVLASPQTVDRLCAPLQTRGEVSCRNGDVVVINAKRWVLGADSYADDLKGYRTYVVNHEVGHSLGLSHRACPAAGSTAPVMLQQTRGLDGCLKNPWP